MYCFYCKLVIVVCDVHTFERVSEPVGHLFVMSLQQYAYQYLAVFYRNSNTIGVQFCQLFIKRNTVNLERKEDEQ